MQQHSHHAHFRRLIAGPYSMSKMVKNEPLIDDIIIAWIRKLNDMFAQQDKAFDMSRWATFAAFDVISLVGFGEAFGFVDTATDVDDLIEELHKGFFYFGIVGRMYPFVEFIKKTWLGRFLVSSEKDKGGMGFLIRWTNRIMKARQKELAEGGKDKGRVDLLQSYDNPFSFVFDKANKSDFMRLVMPKVNHSPRIISEPNACYYSQPVPILPERPWEQ